jgi:hypothetical protein
MQRETGFVSAEDSQLLEHLLDLRGDLKVHSPRHQVVRSPAANARFQKILGKQGFAREELCEVDRAWTVAAALKCLTLRRRRTGVFSTVEDGSTRGCARNCGVPQLPRVPRSPSFTSRRLPLARAILVAFPASDLSVTSRPALGTRVDTLAIGGGALATVVITADLHGDVSPLICVTVALVGLVAWRRLGREATPSPHALASRKRRAR